MKKAIAICTVTAFVLLTLVIGCKKDIKQTENTTVVKSEPPPEIAARFSDNITVSSYGFLEIPTTEDLQEYMEFIIHSTHGEVQDYLDSIGFTSMGASLYDEEYLSETVTEDQAINYVIDPERIVQVKEVVMKPVGETECETVNWEFLLAMKVENLNSSTYEYLLNDTYDENSMDKFATNPSGETENIFDFMELTPYGYEETEANDCPESEELARPFWGEGNTCDNIPIPDAGGGWKIVGSKHCKRYYLFWIPITGKYLCTTDDHFDCGGNPIQP